MNELDSKGNFVFDIEVYPNFFCLCAIDIDTLETEQFLLFEGVGGKIDQRKELLEFLKKVQHMVGYNSIHYDYPVLHRGILEKASFYMSQDLSTVLTELKRVSNDVIKSEYNVIQDKYCHFVNTCLLSVNHYDNPARSTSLKKLEIAMRMDDVRDLPYEHDKDVDIGQAYGLVSYCHHDVDATHRFYNICKDSGLFALRLKISEQYGFDARNMSDSTVGYNIFLHRLAPEMGITVRELKKMRTYRKKIKLADCIPKTIHFETEGFKSIHKYLTSQVISQTKGVFKDLKIQYAGMEHVWGSGGLHSQSPSSVFESNDEYVIQDFDFSSFYPFICMTQGYRPKHLGNTFSKIYKQMYDERKSYSKGTVENKSLKISLNG